MSVEISIIIPTRNRAALLGDCLRSLLTQTLSPERYEICVVDNGSTDDSAQVVAALATEFPKHNLFRVDEPQIGLSFARNRGLASTTAPLVAYGDDDATMPQTWAQGYVERFATLPDLVVKLGGEIIPVWQAPRPAWLADTMMFLLTARSSVQGNDPRICFPGKGEVLVECNCCYRRAALELMEGFPTSLGRKGNNLLSGDCAVDFRLAAYGAGFFYDPALTINHLIHADRLTLAWFRRRYYWQGVTDFATRRYLEQHGVPIPDNHTLSVPMTGDEWARVMGLNETENLVESLAKIRGIGFISAMIGVVGDV